MSQPIKENTKTELIIDETRLESYDDIDIMLEYASIPIQEEALEALSSIEQERQKEEEILAFLGFSKAELAGVTLENQIDQTKSNEIPFTLHASRTPELHIVKQTSKWSYLIAAIAFAMIFISTTGFKSPVITEAISHYRHQLSIDVNSSTSIEAWLTDGSPFQFKLPTLNNQAFLIGARVSRLTTGKDKMQDAVLLSYGVAATHLTALVYEYDDIDFSYDEKKEQNGKLLYFVNGEAEQKPNSVAYQVDGKIYIFTSTLDKNTLLSLF
jgi:hypothetical protein